jgi:hypothetical protein
MKMPFRLIEHNMAFNYALVVGLRHLMDYRRGHNIVMIVPEYSVKGKIW